MLQGQSLKETLHDIVPDDDLCLRAVTLLSDVFAKIWLGDSNIPRSRICFMVVHPLSRCFKKPVLSSRAKRRT